MPSQCRRQWIHKAAAALVAHCGADLIVVGHTHVPLDRTVAGVRVVNLGSVSIPVTPDLRAMYVLLEATRSGYTLHPRRVAYDLDAVIASVERVRHPAGQHIIKFFRGEHLSRWLR